MDLIKKTLRFFAEYFVFFGGLMFIFAIGIIYASLKVETIAIKAVFLLIVIGWIIFIIKYFWDLMEKKGRK